MTRNPSLASRVLPVRALDSLFEALRERGYEVVGPTVRDGAVVYDHLASAADLPVGWRDEQDAATYRLVPRDDEARFGFAVGPHSWKRFLYPPRTLVHRARRDGEQGWVDETPEEEPPRYAFIGVRGCELAAIAVQDRVFMPGNHADPTYAGRREGAFIVALNCSTPSGTCFCVSMGTGPRAGPGSDLALTEILDGEHRFLAEAGTERGAEVLAALDTAPAAAEDGAAADAVVEHAAASMGRTMDTDGIRDLLVGNPGHPRWDDVASRCLTCTNCTMVCPTCFCSTVEDTTDLTGETAERHREWDSCFNPDFSFMGQGPVRSSTRGRYRQWMTHKLATWFDQFGSSGCVGCGRCITWCPVGIDITEEVRAIRESPGEGGAP